jgi:hypothetical protein
MRLATLILALAAACTVAGPVAAQGNDDDYTPLNSRIRRDRQFPLALPNRWQTETTAVSRARSRAMLNQFTKCVFNRSHEDSLELLAKTDYGFAAFEQIGLTNERALRTYGFSNCLERVANTNGTGVQLRFSAGGLRQWLLQEAYFDRYEDAPSWVQPGIVIGPRDYPLSGDNAGVAVPMDLADCVVAADPYTSDFLFRTAAGSEQEGRALEALRPALGGCLPQGQRVELSPVLFRIWIGEALWHAATHSRPAPAEPAAAEEASE